MHPVVLLGVVMNFERSPRKDLAAFGAIWPSVKSWKAILDGVGNIGAE
jgi:hypothetical protein